MVENSNSWQGGQGTSVNYSRTVLKHRPWATFTISYMILNPVNLSTKINHHGELKKLRGYVLHLCFWKYSPEHSAQQIYLAWTNEGDLKYVIQDIPETRGRTSQYKQDTWTNSLMELVPKSPGKQETQAGKVIQTCNSHTWEVEAGRSSVQSQPQLYIEFYGIVCYVVVPDSNTA